MAQDQLVRDALGAHRRTVQLASRKMSEKMNTHT